MNTLAGTNSATSGGLIKDATTETFVEDVIEASRTTLVLVDFWAPWCGPCKQLGPVLEKVVNGAGGTVKLVKMNIDEHPAVASQLGVQSIPAVFAFKDGKPVDGFMGALPESQVKSFIERHVGDAPTAGGVEVQVLDAAEAALEEGQAEAAAEGFAAVLDTDGTNERAIIGLATCLLSLDKIDQARDTFNLLPADKKDSEGVKKLRLKLDLAEKSDALEDTGDLAAKIARDENDHQARFDLALALNARDEREQAAEHLLEIISRKADWNEGAARAQLLEFFDVWGSDDPATVEGRRKLSILLFS